MTWSYVQKRYPFVRMDVSDLKKIIKVHPQKKNTLLMTVNVVDLHYFQYLLNLLQNLSIYHSFVGDKQPQTGSITACSPDW